MAVYQIKYITNHFPLRFFILKAVIRTDVRIQLFPQINRRSYS